MISISCDNDKIPAPDENDISFSKNVQPIFCSCIAHDSQTTNITHLSIIKQIMKDIWANTILIQTKN